MKLLSDKNNVLLKLIAVPRNWVNAYKYSLVPPNLYLDESFIEKLKNHEAVKSVEIHVRPTVDSDLQHRIDVKISLKHSLCSENRAQDFQDYTKNEDIHRLESVIDWLKRAFYITGGKGFSTGFDLRRGWLSPYSETTGYIIPTLYRYAKLFNNPEAFDIATSAAHWLVSIQKNDGAIIDFCGLVKKSSPRPPVTFNTGQDLFGLLAAYRETSDKTFLESAHSAAGWVAKCQSAEGLWFDEASFGATKPASYYTHVTWPLYLIGLETGDSKLIKAATLGLEAVLKNVNPNYTIKHWGFDPNAGAFTHTIAYTIEGMFEQGLLMAGIESAPSQKARSIAIKILDLLEKNGKLAGSYDNNFNGDSSYICMPGNCQMALIYMRLYVFERDNRYKKAAQTTLQPVLAKQFTAGWIPSFARGTVHACWPPVRGKYMRWMYPNWAAKYLADALMFKLYLDGHSCFGNRHLDMPKLLESIPG